MPKRTRREPSHALAADGGEIVMVPLANHDAPAVLDRADFERLAGLGLTGQWTFNRSGPGPAYVRGHMGKAGDNLVTVARIVMAAPRGRGVKYRDGDRRNLRRSNLYLADGPSTGREVAALASMGALDFSPLAKALRVLSPAPA